MKFREHRGTLSESLDTVIEVNSKSEIIKYLNNVWKIWGKEVVDIKFDYCGFDDRINWETYYVLQLFKGETDFVIAGMSDGCI